MLNIDWLLQNSKLTKKKNGKLVVTPAYCLNSQLQQGRKNAMVYSVLFEQFMPCVTKKTVFQRQVLVATNDITLSTVSDEAFALLLLENNYDRWVDIYRRQKGEVTPKRGQKRREFESDVPTKYTKGGIVYDQTAKKQHPKGWSSEGIQRFNELFDSVKQDRKENKSFIKKWLTNKRAQMIGNTQSRKRKQPQPQARIELLESDDDDSIDDAASASIHGAEAIDSNLSGNENE